MTRVSLIRFMVHLVYVNIAYLHTANASVSLLCTVHCTVHLLTSFPSLSWQLSWIHKQPKAPDFGLKQRSCPECRRPSSSSAKRCWLGECAGTMDMTSVYTKITNVYLKIHICKHQTRGFCLQKPLKNYHNTSDLPGCMDVAFGGMCVIAAGDACTPFRDSYISSFAITPLVFSLKSIVMCASD